MFQSDKRYLVYGIHGVIWVCLFLYPFLFHYASLSDIHAIARIGFFILLIMFLFYANTNFLIPKLLSKKRIVLYLVAVSLLIVLVSFASAFLQVIFNPEYFKKPELYEITLNTALIISVLTVFVGSALKVTSEWFRNQQQMRIIENEKLSAELNFLKSQVDPHFLFNALNNIYALETRSSPHTGEAILKLSELMRYVLYETAPEKVSLENEVLYLKNYIDLQKLSLTEQVRVHCHAKGDFTGRKIEPMLLIPLVENVFKHGISYSDRCELKIFIILDGDSLMLHTENPFFENKPKSNRTGIGVLNLRRRLNLLYPDSHSLTAERRNQSFITYLTLKLK